MLHAPSRSRRLVKRDGRLRFDLGDFRELFGQFFGHKATIPHDKIYALLPISTDLEALGKNGLSPDYSLPWSEVIRRLLRWILGTRVKLEICPNRSKASIRASGYVIGTLSEIKGSDADFELTATMEGPPSVSLTLSASNFPLQRGDILCAVQGSPSYSIIRFDGDRLVVIALAARDVALVTNPLVAIENHMAGGLPTTRIQATQSSLHCRYIYDLVLEWDSGFHGLHRQTPAPQGDDSDESASSDARDSILKIDSMSKAIDAWCMLEIISILNIPYTISQTSAYDEAVTTQNRLLVAASRYFDSASVDHVRHEGSCDCAVLPLWYAAARGHPSIVELIITRRSTAQSNPVFGQMPLSVAARFGRKDVVDLLLKSASVDVNARDYHSNVAFALDHWWNHEVRDLLPPAQHFNRGFAALHCCAVSGFDDVLEKLIKHPDIHVDVRDNEGQTPLTLAVSHQNTKIVQLLLKSGKADIHALDSNGRSVLYHAVSRGNIDIVRLLLKVPGVDIGLGEPPPWTIAITSGSESLIQLFLDKNLSSFETAAGDNALMVASKIGNSDIMTLLLSSRQFDVAAQNGLDETALELAAKHGHMDAVGSLLAMPSVTTQMAWRSLSRAIWHPTGTAKAAMIALLLDSGFIMADPDRHNELLSILNEAAIRGRTKVLRFLLDSGRVDIGIEQEARQIAARMDYTDAVQVYDDYAVSQGRSYEDSLVNA